MGGGGDAKSGSRNSATTLHLLSRAGGKGTALAPCLTRGVGLRPLGGSKLNQGKQLHTGGGVCVFANWAQAVRALHLQGNAQRQVAHRLLSMHRDSCLRGVAATVGLLWKELALPPSLRHCAMPRSVRNSRYLESLIDTAFAPEPVNVMMHTSLFCFLANSLLKGTSASISFSTRSDPCCYSCLASTEISFQCIAASQLLRVMINILADQYVVGDWRL